MTCCWQKLTVWPRNQFLCNLTLKITYFGGHESGLPDFGRPWTPNVWHLVNFRPTPENFEVCRFKLAIWEVGGIKIERTRAHSIFFRCDTEIGEDVFFVGKTLRSRIFSMGKFLGQVPSTNQILTHSGFRKYSWFWWLSLRFEVIAAQRPKPSRVKKNRSRYKKLTLLYFSSHCFETNRTWTLHIEVHVLFVSKRSDKK